ncbi:MAG: aldehyde dehydrogenase family protein [Planctomycetota bacterium]
MTRVPSPPSPHAVNQSDEVISLNPATGEVVATFPATATADAEHIVAKARQAHVAWREAPVDERIALIERFAQYVEEHLDALTQHISDEVGKPRWEAATEAKAVVGKAALAIRAHRELRSSDPIEMPGATGQRALVPLGVALVLGPFNFPAHLANGQALPALVAGNAVVFKPSEKAPATGQWLADAWARATGRPEVFQVVHGGRELAEALIDADIDAVLFTGGEPAGRAIHRRLAGRPEVLLALELGGNAPIVIHPDADPDAAAFQTLVSAYATSGQRCTCARRMIVVEGSAGARGVDRLLSLLPGVSIGPPSQEPEPYAGPLIDDRAGQNVLDFQQRLIDAGGKPLARCTPLHGQTNLLSPGVIDVTSLSADERGDEEVFGPLLQVIRVKDLDAAYQEADCTRFGLAASLIGGSEADFERFRQRVRAGVLNWNGPTTGASGVLPFGGLKSSGNHRAAGYAMAHHVNDEAAEVRRPALARPASWPTGITPPDDQP